MSNRFKTDLKECDVTPEAAYLTRRQLIAGAGAVGLSGLASHAVAMDDLTPNGWEEITEITHQPWGARLCSVTTLDGTILNFFELD